jgi:hypothetical protein
MSEPDDYDQESWKSMPVTNKEINAPLPNQILPTGRRFPPPIPSPLATFCLYQAGSKFE